MATIARAPELSRAEVLARLGLPDDDASLSLARQLGLPEGRQRYMERGLRGPMLRMTWSAEHVDEWIGKVRTLAAGLPR